MCGEVGVAIANKNTLFWWKFQKKCPCWHRLRDKPQNGIAMLERMGNPFILTIDDSRGEFAMQLGVDGAPETYVVDEHGMIRYRHSGYMDRETWLTEIKPKTWWIN